MHLQDTSLGFDFDWSGLTKGLVQGAAQYNAAKNQIRVETAKASAAQEQARIASAAAAAAANARRRATAEMPLWRQILPYAVGVGVGVGALVYLTRR